MDDEARKLYHMRQCTEKSVALSAKQSFWLLDKVDALKAEVEELKRENSELWKANEQATTELGEYVSTLQGIQDIETKSARLATAVLAKHGKAKAPAG